MKMREDAVIVICSTPNSKRLHKKAFADVAGIPAIEHILRRVEHSGFQTILAVPEGCNQEYNKIGFHENISIFDGNPDSPMHRMMDAVTACAMKVPEYVIRITHDDIIIDSKTMTAMVDACKAQKIGYMYCPSIVEGAGVEVIHIANLMRACYKHTGEHIEHVSYFVRGDGCPVPSVSIFRPRESIVRPYRLTMDYPADQAVLDVILKELGTNATVDDICSWVDRNPEIMAYNHLPEVTIYTCAKNVEKFIGATMASVFSNGLDVQYVIVDDASTDGTLREILKFAGYLQHTKSMTVLSNAKNMGLASSSNVALSHAKGRYIIRVDGDDILLHHAIPKMLEQIKRENSAIVYPAYTELKPDGSSGAVVAGHVYHHAGCALMDAKLINQIRFTEGLKHCDGLDLYTRIKSRFAVSYNPEPLFMYRQRPDSLSKDESSERKQGFEAIKCKSE